MSLACNVVSRFGCNVIAMPDRVNAIARVRVDTSPIRIPSSSLPGQPVIRPP